MKRTLAAALALALLAACHNDRAVGVSHAAPSAPLYLVDGKEVTFGQVEGMSSSTIESVEVVKGVAALQRYGDRARNGVIVITTKGK